MSKPAELLLTCPHCGTRNFLERGLRAHNCTVVDGPLTPAWIAFAKNKALGITDPITNTTPFTPVTNEKNMSKTDTTHALALISSSELKVSNENLERLQQSVGEQFRKLKALRGEEALRGLLLGLTLHRVKASLPYGQFGSWAKQHACFGERWVSYLMKLALVFIDSSKVTKPEFLALPGDQTELNLEGMEGAQRTFTAKAIKFVGDASLNELLLEHGIKETKKLGGERTKEGTDAPKPAPTPEQMAHMTRDEIGEAINRLELLLIKESRLAYVAGDHDFLRGVRDSVGDLSMKVHRSVDELISISQPAAKAPLTVNV